MFPFILIQGIDNDNQQNQINAQIQDDPDHVDEEGDDYNDGENREGERLIKIKFQSLDPDTDADNQIQH